MVSPINNSVIWKYFHNLIVKTYQNCNNENPQTIYIMELHSIYAYTIGSNALKIGRLLLGLIVAVKSRHESRRHCLTWINTVQSTEENNCNGWIKIRKFPFYDCFFFHMKCQTNSTSTMHMTQKGTFNDGLYKMQSTFNFKYVISIFRDFLLVKTPSMFFRSSFCQCER